MLCLRPRQHKRTTDILCTYEFQEWHQVVIDALKRRQRFLIIVEVEERPYDVLSPGGTRLWIGGYEDVPWEWFVAKCVGQVVDVERVWGQQNAVHNFQLKKPLRVVKGWSRVSVASGTAIAGAPDHFPRLKKTILFHLWLNMRIFFTCAGHFSNVAHFCFFELAQEPPT